MDYDAIVVGLGAMGSAATYHLARRGRRVLGLDAHPPGHTLGSSHGESRIIRLAYSEHSDYVPLLRRAYELWDVLQSESGLQLLLPTGGLFLGRPEAPAIAGALESARLHELEYELLDPAEIRRRYLVFHPGDNEMAFFEPRAGVLFPERCIEAHLRLATLAGAELLHGQPVRAWSPTSDGVEVETATGQFRAARLLLTVGAWLAKLMPGLPLWVERNVVTWLKPRESPDLFQPGRMPIWIWDGDAAGTFYGIPHLERPGVKAARHHSEDFCDPDAVDRRVHRRDFQPLQEFLTTRIPGLGDVEHALVCLYTNSPDEHFIIDRHPDHPQVVYASACSGHGFKFSSVVGEILAGLATGAPDNPAAAFLKADRLGIRPQEPPAASTLR